MTFSNNKMISKGILYLNVKTIAIICLFISYANSSSAEVLRIEGGKRHSVIIVSETDATLTNLYQVVMSYQVMEV